MALAESPTVHTDLGRALSELYVRACHRRPWRMATVDSGIVPSTHAPTCAGPVVELSCTGT